MVKNVTAPLAAICTSLSSASQAWSLSLNP
jgi:hypothetical protein